MWLDSQSVNSINTWDELANWFLTNYFSLSKSMKLWTNITNFRQLKGEPIYEAWEHFKLMVRKCLYHGL